MKKAFDFAEEMMIYYAVSWSIGAGSDADGGNKNNAQFSDVHEKLLGAKEKSGSLTAELIGAPEMGPQRLHVEAENGSYVLSLGEDTGSEYHVRTFTNTNPSDEKNCPWEFLGLQVSMQ